MHLVIEVFATSLQRVDSGPTTRRATVHSLRSGLKIESPKTREGPRVIIFRPWLEKHGSSDATAMVQLKKDARNIAGSAACYHFWSRNRIHFPASCEEPFRSEFDHAPCIYFYFGFFSPRASCVIEISCIGELAQALARAFSAHLLSCQVREGLLRRLPSQR